MADKPSQSFLDLAASQAVRPVDWRSRFDAVPEEEPYEGPIMRAPRQGDRTMDTIEKAQRDRASDIYQSAALAPLGMGKGTAIGHAYDVGGGYYNNPFPGVDPVMLAEAVEGGAALPLLIKAVPLAVKAAGATSIGRFLRQLASDETSGAVFRNMPDAQIDDLAGQIADQHADVSRQAWNTSTARGAADIARARMSARAGQELPGPGLDVFWKELDRYDPAVMGPDAWRKPIIGQINPAWPPARSQRESFLIARAADMEATGVKGVDPETVNQILRQETSAAQVEADLYRYLDGLWEAHVEEVATAAGRPRAVRDAEAARAAGQRPWPPETPEDFARVEREMEAARLRQQREEMEIDRAIERQDPLYESDAPGFEWNSAMRRWIDESDPGPTRDPGMPEYDPNWTPNPDWEARWIAHNPRDYAARKALAEEGYALGYGDADLQSMDPGAEWSNMAGERIPNPNTGRIDYFTDPDAVMPNLAGNRPASIPDAREIPPWRDVGPPTEPTPQPDILPNPIGGRRPSVAPRRPRLPPQVEEGTYAWQFDPEWDDLLREYPHEVMREGVDDIVLQYQRDLEMGNTPTYKEDFMLLGDRAEGVVPIDDLNNWGGVLDEQIALVDEELAAIASGDISNPAHPDYYVPGENMTVRQMREAEAGPPPFTAKELRQRRINEEEGEAAMAILEEGGRTDPPMPPTDPDLDYYGGGTAYGPEGYYDGYVRPGESDPAAGFAEPITELPTSVHEEMAAKARQQGFDPDAPEPKYDDIPSEEQLFEDYLKQVEDTSLDPKPPVTAPPPGRGWSDDPLIHEWLREEGFSPQMPFYLADEAYELVPIARRQELMETMNQMTDDEVAFGLPRLLEVIDELKQAEANGADVSQAMAETMYKLNRAIQRFGPSRSKLMIEADAAGLMPAHAYRDMHARIRKGFDEDTVSRLDKVLGNPADFTPEDYSVLLERSKELSRAGDHEGAEHLLQVLRAWAEGDVNMLTRLSE